MANRDKLLDVYYRGLLLNPNMREVTVDGITYGVKAGNEICVEYISAEVMDKKHNIYLPDGFDTLANTAFLDFEKGEKVINTCDLGSIKSIQSLAFALISVKHVIGNNLEVLGFRSFDMINPAYLVSLEFKNVTKVHLNAFSKTSKYGIGFMKLKKLKLGALDCNTNKDCVDFLDFLEWYGLSDNVVSRYIEIDSYLKAKGGEV